MDHLAFAVSTALAQVLTNLDNLAVLLALLLALGPMRAVGGFVIAQCMVLAAALVLAIGADQALAGWVGYLGVVPIALGLHALCGSSMLLNRPHAKVLRATPGWRRPHCCSCRCLWTVLPS